MDGDADSVEKRGRTLTVARLFSLITMLTLLAGCATSPTGQRQLRLFPDSAMTRMGATTFEQTKSETPLAKDAKLVAYVSCVAQAIIRQTAPGTAWEVRVFESPQINAFALPGGKIGVYTGILGVAQSQHQLAAIIGHEVEHVRAEHGNARVSAAYATQGALAVTQALSGAASPMKDQLFGLLGAGAQYGILMPYGRGQESEADSLGQDLMARAGFDPREAVTLWQNMEKASEGKAPPAFMSTHPANQERIRALGQRMPGALALYHQAQARGLRPARG
jgi:predicted Zn-dependent protease